jgi:hypothetical protein
MALMLFRTKSTSTSDEYLTGVVSDANYRNWSDSLFQLAQQSIHVAITGQSDHDIKLLDLDVQRVIVFAEEYPHFVRKEVGSFLEEKVDIPQCDPLYLGRGR